MHEPTVVYRPVYVDTPVYVDEPVYVDAPVDNAICFPSKIAAVQNLIKSGVKIITVEEASFEHECNTWVTKIKHCESYEEYTTYVHQYEEYVHKYEVTHKGCHYPNIPKFSGVKKAKKGKGKKCVKKGKCGNESVVKVVKKSGKKSGKKSSAKHPEPVVAK